MNLRRLTLKRGEGRRVERGHLWVFSNEVDSLADGPGDECAVYSAKGRFLGSALLSNSALIRARIYSRELEPCGPDMIAKRLADALAFRQRTRVASQSFRLCFAEGDLLPGLIVDVYGSHVVVQITTSAMDARRDAILAALTDLLHPEAIIERSDLPARALEGLPERTGVLIGNPANPVAIEEAGVTYLADLLSGQKTGHFLDQVGNRAQLLPFAHGRRVLDLFCYTGAWSLVLAGAGGAASSHGIDSSEPAIALANAGLERNPQLADRVRFTRQDAWEALKAAAERNEQYDLVIVDPPPLAKRRKDVAEALRAYRDLNMRAMRLLAPGGILATASCSHHITPDDYVAMLVQAARDAHFDWRLLFTGSQAPDHPVHLATPETHYLKFHALEKL